MSQLFSTEGPIYRFLNKTGNIILATVLWIIGCLPVVTIGTSTAALYYTMVKSVRKDVGYVHSEFWRSYKLNLKKGVAATLVILILGTVLGLEMWLVLENGVEVSKLWYSLSGLLILLMVLIILYLFPVMSRFDMKLSKLCTLAFVMSIRFWYITLALAAGLALVVWAQIYLLPIPMILLTPGLWCFVSSFLVEKAMKAYMPKPQQPAGDSEEQVKNWYDD
ncbi:MAG: YesL family protein [Lachnospiraceae bacterium]|nr:YesL family protein [Lachnospiraceae bacterium]